MREIKFRGKRIDNGEWVVGNLVSYISEAKQILIIGTNDLFIDVIPETVSQFTGLKDKNGVEIYEGDIVKPNYNGLGNVIVKFEFGCYNIASYLLKESFVVGNIHEVTK